MALPYVRSRLPTYLKNAVNMNCISFAKFSNGLGDMGSGAGKGGGSGGSIRDAGGAFGKMEAAREEEYFRRLQKMQLKDMRGQIHDEVEFHERHIKHHQDAIDRYKKRMSELKKEEESIDKKK